MHLHMQVCKCKTILSLLITFIVFKTHGYNEQDKYLFFGSASFINEIHACKERNTFFNIMAKQTHFEIEIKSQKLI